MLSSIFQRSIVSNSKTSIFHRSCLVWGSRCVSLDMNGLLRREPLVVFIEIGLRAAPGLRCAGENFWRAWRSLGRALYMKKLPINRIVDVTLIPAIINNRNAKAASGLTNP